MNVHLGFRKSTEKDSLRTEEKSECQSRTSLSYRRGPADEGYDTEDTRYFSDERDKPLELLRIYRKLYENAPLALLITDTKGVVIKANGVASLLLKTPASRIVDRSLKSFFDKESSARFRLFIKRLPADSQSRIDLVLSGDPPRYVQAVGAVGADYIPGKTLYTIGLYEVSQHVYTRKALKVTNDRLRAMINSSQQINSSLDIDTIMRRLVAYAMQIVDGRSGAAGFYRNNEMVFREYNSRGRVGPVFFRFSRGEGVPGYVMETKRPYISNDCRHDPRVVEKVRKALKFYNLIDVPILSKKGELLGCFEIHNKRRHQDFDTDDQKILQGLAAGAAVALENAALVEAYRRAEERVKISEFKYRTLVENANSIIMRWKPDGGITFMNTFARHFFGYEQSEIIGRPVTVLFPTDDSCQQKKFTLNLLSDPVNNTNMECEIIRKDRSKAWVAYTNKLQMDNNGKVLEVLSIGNDITRLKLAEESSRISREQLQRVNQQLQQKNRVLDSMNAKLRDLNRQKTEFVSMASHELRTPLTSIVGFAETLQAQDMVFSDQEQKHFLHIIEMEGKRLADILGDLLDVAKIESGVSEMNLAVMNLASIIDETVEIIKSRKDVRIEKYLSDPETLNIIGDCNRLKQVFVNLLDNAIRYTPPDGIISIMTSPQNGNLRVAISNPGPGIKPEILPHVFDKFVREKDGTSQGSGLGLAIVKSIIEAHGGTIWVDSEPAKGTTFSFTLPRNA